MASSTANAGNEFPENYGVSRARFLERVKEFTAKLGAAVQVKSHAFPVPSKVDKDLAVDSAWFKRLTPSTHDRIFVLVSGTHGAEAFAGSAVQERMFATSLESMLGDADVLMVHGLNPYGFKHFRRVTEQNVDLNRNFGLHLGLYQTQNKGYDKIKPIVEPDEPVSNVKWAGIKRFWSVLYKLTLGGMTKKEFTEAYGNGQYHSPKGLQFGGAGPEPQVGFLRALFNEVFPHYKTVVVVEIHTGLGKPGVLHLIANDEATPEHRNLAREIFKTGVDQGHFEFTDSTSEGFYHTYGDFTDFAAKVAGDKVTVVALTGEFGTLGNDLRPKIESMNRIVMENQGFQYGYANPEDKARVEAGFRELFFPQDPEWQSQILDHADHVFKSVQVWAKGLEKTR